MDQDANHGSGLNRSPRVARPRSAASPQAHARPAARLVRARRPSLEEARPTAANRARPRTIAARARAISGTTAGSAPGPRGTGGARWRSVPPAVRVRDKLWRAFSEPPRRYRLAAPVAALGSRCGWRARTTRRARDWLISRSSFRGRVQQPERAPARPERGPAQQQQERLLSVGDWRRRFGQSGRAVSWAMAGRQRPNP